MKYTTSTTINLPRERVIELFDDADNLVKWQKGLQSFEHLSGEPGQPGAKSLLKYDMDGRQVEMVETITARNLPDEFSGTYEAKGVWNRIENRFFEEMSGRTRWEMDAEFRFSGLMKIMAFFMGGTFKKQTAQMMHDFKTFAEAGEG